MPELPEVETTCRGIEPHLKGRTIAQLVVRQRQLRWPIEEGLEERLPGQQLQQVKRRAKYILIQANDGWLMIHLGMSGSLRVLPTDTPAKAHDHLELHLNDGQMLRFTDPRRFGSVHWLPNSQPQHALLDHLGPEPLSADFDGDYLFKRSRNRKQCVKNFIMDGKIVVGVGNIYASEALYAAGIHPNRPAGGISKKRYLTLATEIQTILANAIKVGGTTLRDFTGGDGQPGYFQQKLNVYGRKGKPCRGCERPIEHIVLGQRASYFCKSCQS